MKFFSFLMIGSLLGCTTTYPNRNVTGEVFPSVTGESLEKVRKNLPTDLKGTVVVLVLGYVQDTQFDIDRWLIGLDQTETKVDVIEVPAIQGMVPRMLSGYIDEGMRKGIPNYLWKGVVTVYKDGDRLQKFTGNTNPRNARVILIDKAGSVKFFSDEGFSVAGLKNLRAAIESANKSP